MRSVLLDLDSTLIDQSYNLTTDVKATFGRLIHSGWLIGLNSDTPLKPLQVWWRKLGLNGPIVAERGAVVWLPDGVQMLTSDFAEVFGNLRAAVIRAFLQIPGCLVIAGDATEFVRTVDRLTGCDTLLVAVNQYRMCSLSFFVRTISDQGQVLKDPIQARSVIRRLSALSAEFPIINQGQLDERYCIFIVNAPDTNKTKGVQLLLDRLRLEEMVMIGDSISDYIDDPRVHHFAVGNATPEFLALCDRAATEVHTRGVIELLDNL